MLVKRAKYAGKCWLCGKDIPKGERCEMERAGWPDPSWRLSCYISCNRKPEQVSQSVTKRHCDTSASSSAIVRMCEEVKKLLGGPGGSTDPEANGTLGPLP